MSDISQVFGMADTFAFSADMHEIIRVNRKVYHPDSFHNMYRPGAKLTGSGGLSAPLELQVSRANEHCEAGVRLIQSILIEKSYAHC